jgi:hypothetical protein
MGYNLKEGEEFSARKGVWFWRGCAKATSQARAKGIACVSGKLIVNGI